MTAMKNLWVNKKKKLIMSISGSAILLSIMSAKLASSAVNNNAGIQTFIALDDEVHAALPFVKDSLCRIDDPTFSLAQFVCELKELHEGKDTVVNIVHLGDSHIQSGFLSGNVMRMLQNAFGNAGRGWITPLKLSSVNEPTDYFISSNIKQWTAGRCVQANPKCPWSIGGIGICTESPEIGFDLIIAPKNGAGYSFNKALLYRDSNSMMMQPVNQDFKLSPEAICDAHEGGLVVDTFITYRLTDTLTVKTAGKPGHKNLYYGFMLTNGQPGVLYHSIGVNGAKFTDFTNRSYIRQLSLLKPSLLIVSLGTNESFGKYFKEKDFENQISAFIDLVKEEMPNTAILLTTPAETYKKVYRQKKRLYVRNENLSAIAGVIRNYTVNNNLACWDLFSMAGGDNSCRNWIEANMLGKDHIHFTQKGYSEQGVLLYKSLIRLCMREDSGEEVQGVE